MVNYNSAVSVLNKAGFGITNKCHYEGETFHDFNSRKHDASVSLIIDESTGSVSRIEVTTRKWEGRRYVPVKETLYGLQQLMDKFAPRKAISL